MNVFSVLITVGIIILGGFFAWHLTRSIVYEVQSKTWPKTIGTVVSSQVVHKISRGRDLYWLAIQYSYTVKTVSYSSNRVSFAIYYYNKQQEADQAISKYPINGFVEVHYHPLKNDIATLESNLLILNFAMLALISVGLLFGLFFILTQV